VNGGGGKGSLIEIKVNGDGGGVSPPASIEIEAKGGVGGVPPPAGGHKSKQNADIPCTPAEGVMLTKIANISRMSKRGETRVESIKRYQRELLIEHEIARNGGRTRPE
jgi:hypothetical protein